MFGWSLPSVYIGLVNGVRTSSTNTCNIFKSNLLASKVLLMTTRVFHILHSIERSHVYTPVMNSMFRRQLKLIYEGRYLWSDFFQIFHIFKFYLKE